MYKNVFALCSGDKVRMNTTGGRYVYTVVAVEDVYAHGRQMYDVHTDMKGVSFRLGEHEAVEVVEVG